MQSPSVVDRHDQREHAVPADDGNAHLHQPSSGRLADRLPECGHRTALPDLRFPGNL